MAAKYEQILEELSKRIAMMQPGDRLPTESELKIEFGVSGMTVRRALQALTEAKRVRGVRGKGTFVLAPTVTKRMPVMSFTESMRMSGMTARTQTISASVGPGDVETTIALELPEGSQVFRINRVRFGDEVALCVETSYLSGDRFPGLLGSDLNGSLFAILERKYGAVLSRSEYRISAVLPTAEQSQLLGISPQTPCVRVRTRTLADDDAVIDSTESIYRGDLYEILIAPSEQGRVGGEHSLTGAGAER